MTTRSSAIRSSIPGLALACLAFGALAAFAGCLGTPEDDTSDSESTGESLIRRPDGGLSGPTCGKKACPTGWVCCNASCGICTPPRGFCIQQYCGPTPEEDGVSAGKCETDADCKAVASCKGCECVVQAATDEQRCTQPRDLCLLNPCSRRQAYCDKGTCRLGSTGQVTR